jgi:hypothetical protein
MICAEYVQLNFNKKCSRELEKNGFFSLKNKGHLGRQVQCCLKKTKPRSPIAQPLEEIKRHTQWYLFVFLNRRVKQIVGKHGRQIQLRTLLNKNGSVIECIFNVGASFYTTCEQKHSHKHHRSETSKNKTYPNTGE